MTTLIGFTDATEAAILNCYIGGTNITAPAACYLGIFSTAPDDAGAGGTELTGNGYARLSVRAKFGTPATADSITNDTAFDMASATGSGWLAGVAVGLFAASSGGTAFAGTVVALPALVAGQFHHFGVGSLSMTLT